MCILVWVLRVSPHTHFLTSKSSSSPFFWKLRCVCVCLLCVYIWYIFKNQKYLALPNSRFLICVCLCVLKIIINSPNISSLSNRRHYGQSIFNWRYRWYDGNRDDESWAVRLDTHCRFSSSLYLNCLSKHHHHIIYLF